MESKSIRIHSFSTFSKHSTLPSQCSVLESNTSCKLKPKSRISDLIYWSGLCLCEFCLLFLTPFSPSQGDRKLMDLLVGRCYGPRPAAGRRDLGNNPAGEKRVKPAEIDSKCFIFSVIKLLWVKLTFLCRCRCLILCGGTKGAEVTWCFKEAPIRLSEGPFLNVFYNKGSFEYFWHSFIEIWYYYA